MTLKVKEAPAKLLPQVIETIWPGDDAVDLEASDLVAWCRRGGREGLRLRDTGTPTIIRWKPLDEMAWGRVLALSASGSPNVFATAARHGIIGADGLRLEWTRIEDSRGLSDATMAMLGDITMALPFGAAIAEVRAAMTGQEQTIDVAQWEAVSLTQVLGAHVIAATFRARGTVV